MIPVLLWVASERVRDKIRASKAKGLWMGGIPPLGYDNINKKLIINPGEADMVRSIFEKYNELESLNELHQWCIANNVKNKQWTTQKDTLLGGTVFCKHALNNLLRNPVYIGKVRNKKTNEIYPDLHDGIIPSELFNKTQELLSQNNNRQTSQCLHRRYMLHRKIFDMAGNMFTNKSTGKSTVRHYCRLVCYLAAGDIERITCDTIQELLNGDLSQLIPADIAQTWKAIDIESMTYDARTKLLKTLLARAVYNNSHMTFYINIAQIADEFQTPCHTNTCNVPLSTNVCLSNDGQHIIIERPVIINNRVSTNRYETCGRTVMTMQENNLQLTRALAYGWRYKSMFERGITIEQIAKTEHKAERTIYKYLALAYLSPKIVSDIMNGSAPAVDLQTLFNIAAKHMDFKEQEKEFYHS